MPKRKIRNKRRVTQNRPPKSDIMNLEKYDRELESLQNKRIQRLRKTKLPKSSGRAWDPKKFMKDMAKENKKERARGRKRPKRESLTEYTDRIHQEAVDRDRAKEGWGKPQKEIKRAKIGEKLGDIKSHRVEGLTKEQRIRFYGDPNSPESKELERKDAGDAAQALREKRKRGRINVHRTRSGEIAVISEKRKRRDAQEKSRKKRNPDRDWLDKEFEDIENEETRLHRKRKKEDEDQYRRDVEEFGKKDADYIWKNEKIRRGSR